jgi:hypothetical protein
MNILDVSSALLFTQAIYLIKKYAEGLNNIIIGQTIYISHAKLIPVRPTISFLHMSTKSTLCEFIFTASSRLMG